jgi:hypothetical protein
MSLRKNDLRDLVSTKIHVDEFESKMGKDDDILVISFKLPYRDPAADLVNYLEKGYEWVLDADISAGTVEDGGWIVFVEASRRPSMSRKLYDLLDDMRSLTGNKIEEYSYRYKNDRNYQPFTVESFEATVPLSPREYRRREKSEELQSMIESAGVKNTGYGKFTPEVAAFANLSRYR